MTVQQHSTHSIAFIDTEVDPRSRKIIDIGAIKEDGSHFHQASVAGFIQFVTGTEFICGHNILNHDIKYIGKALSDAGIHTSDIVDTLFVSTIHKAKGREFSNVFLMLDRFSLATSEAKRQLYVAITRAKQNLFIHLNADFLDAISTANMERIEDREVYESPKEIVMQLTYRDVWLDSFINNQLRIRSLRSGDDLVPRERECLDLQGHPILSFSKQFIQKIEALKEKNYMLKHARVNFIVYWQRKEAEQELQIVLPELLFIRSDSQ